MGLDNKFKSRQVVYETILKLCKKDDFFKSRLFGLIDSSSLKDQNDKFLRSAVKSKHLAEETHPNEGVTPPEAETPPTPAGELAKEGPEEAAPATAPTAEKKPVETKKKAA